MRGDSIIIQVTFAGVMELVDVVDSKSTAGDSVPVRARSPAPDKDNPNQIFFHEDWFGLSFSFQYTFFRNGVIVRPESQPKGPRKRRG